ncbi:DUF6798 domain-containing protein [Pleurocapsa sp. PCC 7319]|uniref:DUF6798 domain-containing protein n=1 Tax=Pleurocapsa sp. PCC 7319 TaxID=118161 RepID=UPI000568917D|nr:DUF6798 domain-containing protein [Pleurocapsa sp. PCC 7319]
MKLHYFFKHQRLVSVTKFLLISLIFGLAYTQDPIYNSPENQNTKFLHGLANAGYGFLNEDWVANTIDPLPAFSWLVEITCKYIHPEYMFYVYYFLIFGTYVYSILAIVNYIYDFKKNKLKTIVYFTILIIIHTVHLKIFQFDLGRDLHYGVAGQYVLGKVFQPSTFGVFIILSICCSLYKRYYLAVFLLALAATFHPTYLVSAGILTFAYLIVVYIREKNLFKIFFMGLLSLILVLPVYSYMSGTFTPTNPQLWHQAQEFIVQLRIPHHSLPQVWLREDGYKAYIQACIVIFALWLVRKSELFLILLIPFLATVLSTIIQLLVNSNTIAFIAPWRLSIFLVPIATSIVLAQIVTFIFNRYRVFISKYQQVIVRLCITIISIIVIVGTINQVLSFGYGKTSNMMMDFVRENRQSGETYLIPPDMSDMRKFRLSTGSPIFINDKTHPYKDIEVLEWVERLKKARDFYQMSDRSCQILSELVANYSITHVVLYKEQRNLECDHLKRIYRNKKYQVAKIE